MILTQWAIQNNHTIKLEPLLFDPEKYQGPAITNPSIIEKRGKLYVLLRNVNYTLCHAERSKFPHRWGPLIYIHREDDVKLRTWNWIGELDDDLKLHNVKMVNTTELDERPLWEFIGLEDARLINNSREGEFVLCGVRRDTTTNGEGRMEYSYIREEGDTYEEYKRIRIEPPKESYCEKNWMPIQTMPRHFVKWSNPVEVVKVNRNFTEDSKFQEQAETIYTSNMRYPLPFDWRGGSQVIPFDEERFIFVVHESDFAFDQAGKKNATYRHRFILMNQDTFEIEKYSPVFSFMDGKIEFCCGMVERKGSFYITFGYQDTAAFVMSLSKEAIEEFFDAE